MITILCGRVAAGKTAWALRERARTGALHLSCDDMMLSLYDGCLGEKHDETAMRCLRFLFSLAAQAAQSGLDATIDYGFWLRAERDAARAYFKERGLPCRLLVIETDEQTRLSRLARRNETLRQADSRVYLIEGALLTRLDARFAPLSPEEDAIFFDNTPQR